MKSQNLSFGVGFRVGIGNSRGQAVVMTIRPGKAEGNPENSHRGSDQWLFVLSGRGVAYADEVAHPIKARTLLLIERGDRHEIRNTGKHPLRTLNIYVPPAYQSNGEPLPRGRQSSGRKVR